MLEEIPEALRAEAQRRYAEIASAAPDDLAAVGKQLTRVIVASPFCSDYATRNPRRFLELIGSESVTDERTRDALTNRVADFVANADEATAMRALRTIRTEELIRIAWRDINGLAELDTILHELSMLADVLIAAAVDFVAANLSARFGAPADASDRILSLIVIGMGKLGGEELNFSSDIDLIFVFPEDGNTQGGRKSITNQEYFDRLGRKFIALLDERTADGIVFRVDMRLRPFGDSGPLTTHFAALEHYYSVHGRDWERYALIKARPLCGERRDIDELHALIRPFVYRRYLDFGALEALREMKRLIDDEVARGALESDVKRGSGGIREIEFIGQAFQLIRGGQEPALQQRSILKVLARCCEFGWIEPEELQALSAAYRFLRQTEHRLQQVADRQTHQLPTDAAERARLAYAMNYSDWSTFYAALERHRENVRHSFSVLLKSDDAKVEAHTSNPIAASTDIQQPNGAHNDYLQALLQALDTVTDANYRSRLSREAHQRLERLLPVLAQVLATQAARSVTVTRLAELIRAIARRSVYLALLSENPAALTRLVDLYSASSWIARQITLHPILLDELLDARVLFAPPTPDELERQYHASLAKVDRRDLDRVMDAMRRFAHQQILRVAASDVSGHLPITKVSDHLTYISETLLAGALTIARADLCARYGEPCQQTVHGAAPVGFAIIAYGKLGGLELGYGSDLDLIFVYDHTSANATTSGPKVIANEVFFTRLAQRIIHLLSTRTAAGIAYEIDTRLRPSGTSGLLVTSLEAFRDYQHKNAWTWEHQALVRARGIAGAELTLQHFASIREEVLRQTREPAALVADIVDMRKRMRAELDRSDAEHFDLKQGHGGITDIEFMVQYAVLRWANAHPELFAYTDNLRQLEALATSGLWPVSVCRDLHDAYFDYRAAVHHCALQEIEGLVSQSELVDQRQAVQGLWQNIMERET